MLCIGGTDRRFFNFSLTFLPSCVASIKPSSRKILPLTTPRSSSRQSWGRIDFGIRFRASPNISSLGLLQYLHLHSVGVLSITIRLSLVVPWGSGLVWRGSWSVSWQTALSPSILTVILCLGRRCLVGMHKRRLTLTRLSFPRSVSFKSRPDCQSIES